MILSAGLSPAWQQIVVLDALKPGEVNRAREVHWCASGKVLNVGIALGHLRNLPMAAGDSPGWRSQTHHGGQENQTACEPQKRVPAVLTLAPVGGAAGAEIQREFESLGVPAQWIEVPQATRVCTTLLDRATGQTTEIVENARTMDRPSIDQFCAEYLQLAKRAKTVVLAGSFPPGVETTLYRDLIRQTAAPVMVDAQGPPLLSALEARPFLIKPNREELGRTLGRSLHHRDDLISAMRECHERGARWVVVTQGSLPVLLWSSAGFCEVPVPPVMVNNPIGCGDCLAAGLAFGVAHGWNIADALTLALASAAQNAEQLLPARLETGRVVEFASLIGGRSVAKLDG